MKIKRNSFCSGIGIDITYISLFEDNFEKLAKKILTKKEFIECLIKDKKYWPQYLASRWAAKEAVWKSLSNENQNFSLLNIEILNDLNGKPYCSNFDSAKISISYCKNIVIAFCIFFEK